MAEGESEELSGQDFEQKVIKSQKPVLVGFGADWCAVCKSMEPIIADFIKKQADKIEFLKINIEKNPNIASKYKVMGLPTFLLFSEGKIVSQITGAVSPKELEKKLTAAL